MYGAIDEEHVKRKPFERTQSVNDETEAQRMSTAPMEQGTAGSTTSACCPNAGTKSNKDKRKEDEEDRSSSDDREGSMTASFSLWRATTPPRIPLPAPRCPPWTTRTGRARLHLRK